MPTVGNSFAALMSPIKSVSGVIVAGRPDIHGFDNNFDFCRECVTKECRVRIASLRPHRPAKN